MKVNEGTSKEHESGGWLKDHHIRHLVSGSIVFILGVCADIAIVENRNKLFPNIQGNAEVLPDRMPENTIFFVSTNGTIYKIDLQSNHGLRWHKL